MKNILHLKINTDITSESLVSEPGSHFLRDNAQEDKKLLAPPYLNLQITTYYVQEMLMCYHSTHSHHRIGPIKQRYVFPSFSTTFKVLPIQVIL